MDPPPRLLDSAIIFAPAGELVPHALEALDRGGTLALAGIHMSPVPTLDYDRHLFLEKNIRSVRSNTRADGEALFQLAGRLALSVHTTRYSFDEVDRALEDLSQGRVSGSLVVTM
jgi:alcohol dehydrogenase, propanol-preferring